jgi:Acetyltransferase (GNAT) family
MANKILQWRYCELEGCEMMLAYDGDRPVGMIASYLRPYLVRDEVMLVREASDWICLPEYRHLGIGVLLMSNLMDEKEPLLGIGGSETAQAVLSGLGWRRLPDIKIYTLPLSTKFPVNKAWRFLSLPKSGRGAVRLFETRWPPLPRLRRKHYLARAWRYPVVPQTLPVTAPHARFYELMPLLREHEMQWLYAAPKEMGMFFFLAFLEDTGPAGFSIGRLYSQDGLKHAKLIHIQTEDPSVEVYGGILEGTIQYCYAQGADVAQFRAFCPVLCQALKDCGFLRPIPAPVYWWAKNGMSPGSDLHLTFLRGDDGVLPYPE